MIMFSTEESFAKGSTFYLSEDSNLVIPLPDISTEDYNFYINMKVCRDNDIAIKHVQLGGKHANMLFRMSNGLPYFYKAKTIHYHGDLASFIVHNYASWLRGSEDQEN